VFEQASLNFMAPFSKQRVVHTSGPHAVNVRGLEPNDVFVYRKDGCSGAFVGASSMQTDLVTMQPGDVELEVLLPSTLTQGQYHACHKPATASAYRSIAGLQIDIIAKPSFSPLGGKVGEQTLITASAIAAKGDWLALVQNSTCADAYLIGGSATTLAASQLDIDRQLFTSRAMNVAGFIQVCYAPSETAGDSAEDWVLLDPTFEQTSLVYLGGTVRRLVAGSGPHRQLLGGLSSGDVITYRRGSALAWSAHQSSLPRQQQR